MREHRLIGYTASDFDNQKKIAAANLAAAGGTAQTSKIISPVTNKQVSMIAAGGNVYGTPSSRLSGTTIAQTNAANQAVTYQNTLANNPNLKTTQQTYQTYIDPATGKDTRTFTQDYTVTDPVTGIKTTYSGGIQQPQGTYNKETGAYIPPTSTPMLTGETHGVLGAPSVADPNQGTSTTVGDRVTTVPLGQTAGAGGQAGATGFNPSTVSAGSNTLNFDTQITDLNAKIEDARNRGNLPRVWDQSDPNYGKLTGEAARSEEQTYRDQLAEVERQKADKIAADKAAADKKAQEDQVNLEKSYQVPPAVKEETTALTGVDAAIKQLMQENPTMGAILQNVLDQNAQNKTQTDALYTAMLKGGTVDMNGEKITLKSQEEIFGDVQKTLDAATASTKRVEDMVQTAIDEQKVREDKYLAEQQAANEQRLLWDKNNQLRDAADQRDDQIESTIARLALTGGIGSSGGNAEVQGVKTQFNNAMQRIREEYGVQATELSAKFTGLYLQASEDYTSKTITNWKDTLSQLNAINGQSAANAKAKAEAKTGIIKDWMTSTQANQKERDDTILGIVKEMQTMENQKRDDERAMEQLGWTVLDKAIDDYGTGIPQSILDRVKKMIPGVDLADVAKAKTLAQQKKGGGSGGSAAITFPSYQQSPTGKSPTFDQYVAQKEQDSALKGATMFDTSKTAMAQYQKEYNAIYATSTALNWDTLDKDYQAQRATFDKVASQKAFDQAYQLARDANDPNQAEHVLDFSRKPLSGTDVQTYKAALNVRDNIGRMLDLMEKTKEKYGPIQGPIWTFVNDHISTDTNLQVLQSYQNSILGAFARGVMLEKGVLTEGDIDRARAALGGMNMSYEAAVQVLAETKKTSQIGLQNSLNIDKNNGSRIDEIANQVNNYQGKGTADPAPLPDSDEAAIDAFINSRH